MRVVERRIEWHGQQLLIQTVEVVGWWTSLGLPDPQIIELRCDHATSEQFQIEFKTDLESERFPSGKLDTNALVMADGGRYLCSQHPALDWTDRFDR